MLQWQLNFISEEQRRVFLFQPLPQNTDPINDNWWKGDTCLTLVYLPFWVIWRTIFFFRTKSKLEKLPTQCLFFMDRWPVLCGVLSAALDINRVLLDHWVSVKTCKKKKEKITFKGIFRHKFELKPTSNIAGNCLFSNSRYLNCLTVTLSCCYCI